MHEQSSIQNIKIIFWEKTWRDTEIMIEFLNSAP